jgi:hypothetical protein
MITATVMDMDGPQPQPAGFQRGLDDLVALRFEFARNGPATRASQAPITINRRTPSPSSSPMPWCS